MDISYAIKENIKLGISKYLPTTTSPLVDMMITTFLFMFLSNWISNLFDNVNILKDKLKVFCYNVFKKYLNPYNEIILTGTKTRTTNYYGNQFEFSDRFLATNNYIINNLSNIEGVSNLKEELIREFTKNEEFHTLILDHRNYLPLNKNIEVKYLVEKRDTDDDKSKKSLRIDTTTIYIRSKTLSVVEINKFIEDITEDFLKEMNLKSIKNQYYFEFESIDEDGYCHFSETVFSTKKSYDSIFFDKKEEFIKKYKFFHNNKEWYDNLELPWHFGVLLYGKPGCGKTSLIKAMAKENKDCIISIPLSRVKTSKDLSKIFHLPKINRQSIPMDRRIYLFEDIDAMNFSLDRNISKKEDDVIVCEGESTDNNKLAKLIKSESIKVSTALMKDEDPLTLAHFLNLIDGLLEMPGRRIIFTTNHREKLDPALIRPGRIDIEIEMDYASSETINKMFQWFYKEKSLSSEVIKNIPSNKLTPAEVNNIFYQYYDNMNDAIDYICNIDNM